MAVIISCASAMDLPSCEALVKGLGSRKAETDGDVFYIHVQAILDSLQVCIANYVERPPELPISGTIVSLDKRI